MRSNVFTLRFPRGTTEFRHSDARPAIGDTFDRGGEKWVVVAVEESRGRPPLVMLSPAASEDAIAPVVPLR